MDSKLTEKDVVFVTTDEYKSICDSRIPQGIFYTKENGLFLSVDNEGGEAFVESHSTKEEMNDWLFNKDNF